ncbi:MAG: helix-turn-helix domain-containing protein [Chitinophagales bacterium]
MSKRYIKLKEAEIALLEGLKKGSTSERVRHRAQALLLSDKGFDIATLSNIFGVYRDTISVWFSNWERAGEEGLLDKAKSGRPRKFSAEEEKNSGECVK